MDCQTARQWIDLHPGASRDWECAEGAEVRNHLASCELCQPASEDIREFDGRVKSLLHDVEIPEGLKDRILAQVQRANPQIQSRETAPRKWALRLVGLGLSMLLAVGGWYWATRVSAMTVAGLGDSAASMLLAAKSAPKAFDGSFAPQISDALWRRVAAPQPVGWDLDGRPGHDVAAFRVSVTSLRFRGWLVVIPISRISDAPSHSDPVRLSYARSAVWADQNFVYICLAEQGSIEALIDQWGGGAA